MDSMHLDSLLRRTFTDATEAADAFAVFKAADPYELLTAMGKRPSLERWLE